MDKRKILSVSADAPAFEIVGDWRRRAGCGDGLGQSALVGRLRIALPVGYDPAPLEQWMTDDCRLPPAPCETADASARAVAVRAAHWVLAVQRREGVAVGARAWIEPLADEDLIAGDSVAAGGEALFRVSLPSVSSEATTALLGWVRRAINAFIAGDAAPGVRQALATELEGRRRALAPLAEPGQNSAFIAQHAIDAALPVQRVVNGIVRIGTGARARVLYSSITDRTPSVGVAIAGDKMWTARVLRSAGLPGATHRLAANPQEAIRIAAGFGFPVVVKPADQEQGRGVFADLRDARAVGEAWSAARKFSERVLVERHFEGFGHRLTIFQDQLFKVTRKLPGGVVGDGSSSIAELVKRTRPKRGGAAPRPDDGRPPLELDREALGLLAQYGLSPDSIPAEGARIALRRRNNATTGGTTEVLTPQAVHPDNLALGLRAARLLGLDWAGVDLLIPDIAVSWFASGALICEVNAQPQVDRKTAGLIVDTITAGGCRIPVHLAVCTGTDPSTTRALAERAQALGCDGLSMQGGVWIRGRRIASPLPDGLMAGQALLCNPDVGVALCAMTPAEIMDKGLPVDRFDSCCIAGDPPSDAAARQMLEAALRFVAPHLAAG
jgi:cyanophycin synthetase